MENLRTLHLMYGTFKDANIDLIRRAINLIQGRPFRGWSGMEGVKKGAKRPLPT